MICIHGVACSLAARAVIGIEVGLGRGRDIAVPLLNARDVCAYKKIHRKTARSCLYMQPNQLYESSLLDFTNRLEGERMIISIPDLVPSQANTYADPGQMLPRPHNTEFFSGSLNRNI